MKSENSDGSHDEQYGKFDKSSIISSLKVKTISAETLDGYRFSFKNFLSRNTNVRMDVSWVELCGITPLTESSTSQIFEAVWDGKSVVIKLIKAEQAHIPSRKAEFECETDSLSRMNHTNVIKFLGFGHNPLPFIVLENLSKGSVAEALGHREIPKLSTIKKRKFSYLQTLQLGRRLAEAINYLHNDWNPEVHVIHRDLKPGNMGWNDIGEFKIFDFGLCTCVKIGQTKLDTYELTGCTGSMRYMAPEVALQQPYNQSVDVYAFGVIIWEIYSGKIAFAGAKRETFLEDVVHSRYTNPCDPLWPSRFTSLIQRCFDHDYRQRPDIMEVLVELNVLIDEELTLQPSTEQVGCSLDVLPTSLWSYFFT